jgi:hypothetical protein
MANEEKSKFAKLKEIADLLKSLIGLIAVVFPLASWYDPTFWGLLWLSPVIAAEAFRLALFASILLVAFVVLAHIKELKKDPDDRRVNLRRKLLANILVSFGSVVLINGTATYLWNNPFPAEHALWGRYLLQAEYVLFIALTVFFIARIAMRLFPRIGAADADPISGDDI